MATELRTLSDYYQPLQSAQQAEQIKSMRLRNQSDKLAMLAQQQKQQQLQSYLAGGETPTLMSALAQPQQAQPATVSSAIMQPNVDQTQIQPTPTQETPADPISAGQKKITAMVPLVNDAYKMKSASKVNALNRMVKSDKDVQAAISASGFDDIDFGYDEKSGKAWQRYTKTWTKPELEKMAMSVPGGQVLSGLPEGNYTIEYDPLNNRIMPTIKGEGAIKKGAKDQMDILSDTSLTDTDLVRASLFGTPEQKRQAQAILEKKSQYAAEAYGEKYGGGITQEGINFGAEQYVYTGKMPPMGRSPRVRAQIMQEAANIAKSLGMTVPQLLSMQSEKKGLALSLNQQQKQRGAMGSFVRNIDKQVSQVKKLIPELGRMDTRVANIPQREFRNKILGSAKERIFDTYLGEISSEIAKLASGATGSVAEVSISARQKWEEIHDPNLPAGEMIKLLDEIQHLGKIRLKSVDDEIAYTKEQIGINPKKREKDAQKKRFKILAVE
jgi:hypothetical protein